MTPTLVYDGDCGICTRLSGVVVRWVRRGPDDFDVVPFQYADLPSLGLTEAQCADALQWVGADGRTAEGPNAVAGVLRAGRLPWRPVGRALTLPGVPRLAWPVYRWVAAHRHRLPGGTPACSMPAERRPH